MWGFSRLSEYAHKVWLATKTNLCFLTGMEALAQRSNAGLEEDLSSILRRA